MTDLETRARELLNRLEYASLDGDMVVLAEAFRSELRRALQSMVAWRGTEIAAREAHVLEADVRDLDLDVEEAKIATLRSVVKELARRLKELEDGK